MDALKSDKAELNAYLGGKGDASLTPGMSRGEVWTSNMPEIIQSGDLFSQTNEDVNMGEFFHHQAYINAVRQ